VDVSVLSVEYLQRRSGGQAYVDFMKQQGYYEHKFIQLNDPLTVFVNDFIFVKKTLSDR